MKTLSLLLFAGIHFLAGLLSPQCLAADDENTTLDASIAKAHAWLQQRGVTKGLEERAQQMGKTSFYGQRLRDAVIDGDAAKAREVLVTMPELVNGTSSPGKHLLLIAAERGHTEVVKVLLEYKADVHVHGDGLMSGGSKQTALHLAAVGGHKEIVEVLLRAGAAVDDAGEFSRNTPLLKAILKWCEYSQPTNQYNPDLQKADAEAKESATLLLQSGADIFATNASYHSTSPLERTISRGRLDWTELLLIHAWIRPRWTNQPDSLLHVAARLGLPKAVDALLKKGLPVNVTNRQGFTALQLSAILDPSMPPQGTYGDPAAQKQEVADLLRTAGAPIDIFAASGLGDLAALRSLMTKEPRLSGTRDTLGRSPLHWAAITGQSKAAEFLLQSGADLRVADDAGRLAIHEASAHGYTNIVTLLLSNKSSLSIADKQGRTALHEAADRGHAGIAKLLINASVNLNATNNQGDTAMDLAAKHNHGEIVQLLLDQRAKLKKGGDQVTTPLHSGVSSGNRELAHKLLREGSKVNALNAEGKRPIHLAVERHDLGLVELLLKWGADINARDTNGDTVLHYCLPAFDDIVAAPPASPGWRKQLVDFVGLDKYVTIPPPTNPPPMSLVRYLLDHKADPNATNLHGHTPLHKLAEEQQFGSRDDEEESKGLPDEEADIIALLVARGANINARDEQGMTPLHRVADGNCSLHAARLLLKHGADPNARTTNGRTPLHLAVKHVGWKREDGWSTNADNMVSLLLAHGADVNAQAGDGRTPLHVLVVQEMGYKNDWMPLLLKAGATVNLKDKLGRTPLHAVLATKWPWDGLSESINLLVQNGADINARDRQGQTPVHYLAKLTDKLFFLRGVPEALLSDKADVNAQDKDGNTPLHLAARAGNGELMKLLVSKGAK